MGKQTVVPHPPWQLSLSSIKWLRVDQKKTFNYYLCSNWIDEFISYNSDYLIHLLHVSLVNFITYDLKWCGNNKKDHDSSDDKLIIIFIIDFFGQLFQIFATLPAHHGYLKLHTVICNSKTMGKPHLHVRLTGPRWSTMYYWGPMFTPKMMILWFTRFLVSHVLNDITLTFEVVG